MQKAARILSNFLGYNPLYLFYSYEAEFRVCK